MTTEHKSFFRTHTALSLLPLLALGAAVFWHVSGNGSAGYADRGRAGPDFGKTAPASAPETAPARNEAGVMSALEIQGSPEFRRRITGALRLIWLSDRATFLFIRKQLFVIRSEDKTDFYLDAGVPVAAISNAHAFRSIPWCSGIIAHLAFHSYLRSGSVKKRAFLPPPPGTEKVLRVEANPASQRYTGLESLLDRERRASEFQAKVLIATGASRAETGSVKNRGPEDFTTGHDGNYSLLP